jgi:hypothetical protein
MEACLCFKFKCFSSETRFRLKIKIHRDLQITEHFLWACCFNASSLCSCTTNAVVRLDAENQIVCTGGGGQVTSEDWQRK